jgi:hypothetical protein
MLDGGWWKMGIQFAGAVESGARGVNGFEDARCLRVERKPDLDAFVRAMCTVSLWERV